MMEAPKAPDLRRFTALMEEGYSLKAIAEETGFSYGQVRGAVHRYKLRKGPSPAVHSPFTHKQRTRMKALAIQRVKEGHVIPAIAEEVRRRTGHRISYSALRLWVPAHLDETVRENARRAKITHNRKNARRYHDDVANLTARIEELEYVNGKLRQALRAKAKEGETHE